MILTKDLKRFTEKPSIKGRWLFLLLLLAFIPQLLFTWKIVQNSLMSDFYSRILGTRLLLQNKSPYFYNGFFNYANNAVNTVNGVTASPLALLLQAPLAKLNYCTAKTLWWIIEELLLFTATFFACLYSTNLIKQLITIIVTLAFFCYSRNWSLHIFSGQYYVLFAFIFSLTSYYYKKGKPLPLLLFPLSALLRPFFALAILPYFLKNIRSKVKWLFTGMAFALIVLVISDAYKLMPEYNAAMNVYSSEITGWADGNSKKSVIVDAVEETCTQQTYHFETDNPGCLFLLQHYLKFVGVSFNSPLIYTVFLFVFLCIILVPVHKRIIGSSENIIIAAFLIYMFSEIFTPANRNPYNLVQYLGIIGVLMNKANFTVIAIMVTGLAFNHSLPISFRYQKELGEAIFLFGIYFTLFVKTTGLNIRKEL